MSKEYESKTEHKENLIDIAGLFDDLIKGNHSNEIENFDRFC